jgi:hypothetical protein
MPASLTSTSIHLQVSAIKTRVFTAANTDPQLGLPGQELGFLALLPDLGAALLRLVLAGLLGLGEAGFHLLGDALDLLLAQRSLHCG